MNDLYFNIKVQHGRLRTAMREMGYKTLKQLAEASGSNIMELCRLMNFKVSARYSMAYNNRKLRGQWKPWVLRICNLLGYEPSDLFPEHMDKVLPSNIIEAYSDLCQISGLSDIKQLTPYDYALKEDAVVIIHNALERLSIRERKAVESCVMHDQSPDSLCREWNISRSRLYQIRDKGIKKLRAQVENGGPLCELFT